MGLEFLGFPVEIPSLTLLSVYADESPFLKIGYGSNKKTRHLMPSGHKAFVVHNPRDVDLLLMHSKTFAAEYVHLPSLSVLLLGRLTRDAKTHQDFPRRVIEKKSGYREEGEGIGCEGHKRKGEGYDGVVTGLRSGHGLH